MESNYRRIARRAVPVKAACYDCDKEWSGPTSRLDAIEHRDSDGHAVWVECKPHGDDE